MTQGNRVGRDADMQLSQEEMADLFQTLTFGWLNETISRGYLSRLEPRDALSVPLAYDHTTCFASFKRAWKERQQNQSHWRMFLAVHDVVGPLFWTAMTVIIVSVGLDLAMVFFVNRLITFIETQGKDGGNDDGDGPGFMNEGLVWALALGGGMAVNAFLRAHAMYWCKLCGIMIRNCVFASIFDKILGLGPSARETVSGGKVVNQMAADAQRFLFVMPGIQNLLLVPLYVVYVMGYLWALLGGWAALAGLLTMFLAMTVASRQSKRMKKVQGLKSACADARVEAVGEVVSGSLVVKLFCWEGLFETKIVSDLRAPEASHLSEFARLQQLNAALSLTTPALTLLAMLGARQALGNLDAWQLLLHGSSGSTSTHALPQLSLAAIFTALALVGTLQAPLSGVSDGLASLAQAMVALGRLERFLVLGDRVEQQVTTIDDSDHGDGGGGGCVGGGGAIGGGAEIGCSGDSRGGKGEIGVGTSPLSSTNDAAAIFGSWVFANNPLNQQEQQLQSSILQSSSPTPQLALVTDGQGVRVPKGKLIVVCGPTGAGKSAFLLGLLGELDPSLVICDDQVDERNDTIESAQSVDGPNDVILGSNTSLQTPLLTTSATAMNGVSGEHHLTSDNKRKRNVAGNDGPLGDRDGGVIGVDSNSLAPSMMPTVRRSCSKVAFVPQDAFIFNGTLADNVIFFHYASGPHSPSSSAPNNDDSDDGAGGGESGGDPEYSAALAASALEADLSALPGGDQTEVGSKGLNLSGGQKQRVSIARALYSGADLFLLDDPLSAVDAHVAKHLWEKAIKPLVAAEKGNKTVVLVTSNLALVARDPAVHEILVIDNGRVVSRGDFQHLVGGDGSKKSDISSNSSQGCAIFKSLLETFSAKASANSAPPSNLETLRTDEMSLQLESSAATEKVVNGDNDDDDDQALNEAAKNAVLVPQSEILPLITLKETIAADTPSPITSTAATSAGALTGLESRHAGAVRSSSYARYFCGITSSDSERSSSSSERSCGPAVVVGALVLFPVCETLNTLQSYWLASEAQRMQRDDQDDDDTDEDDTDDSASSSSSSKLVAVYGVLVGVTFACLCLRAVLFSSFIARSASSLHAQALRGVLRSPMSFFDTTPAGRILNRFANDQDDVDSSLPLTVASFLVEACKVIGVLTLATIAVPPFALVVPFVAYAFMGVTERYRRSSREVQRLLAISRSPLFTTVEEALVGLVTIRAFNVQKRQQQQQQQHAHSSPTNSHSRQSSFQDVFNARVRASTAWAYMKLALDQWLLARLSLVSAVVVTAMSVFMVILPALNRRVPAVSFELDTAVASLALAFSVQLVPVLRFAVRFATDSEAKFNAVDRMLDFSDLEPEGGSCIDQGTGKADKEFWCQSQTFLRTSGEVAPHSTSMPSSSGLAFSTPVTAMTNKMRYERGAPLLRKEGDLNQQQEHQQQEGHVDRLGRLQVQSLYARHRAHLPLVLRGVSFEMTAGEHVGVVGRTGSGKSSLAQALVRLIEPFSLPPGRAPVVLLDGIDTNALSLHALRRAIAVVPQDAVLFRGTVRSNLDPFDEHTDSDLWRALEQAELADTVKHLPPPPPSPANLSKSFGVESSNCEGGDESASSRGGGGDSSSCPRSGGLDSEVQGRGANFSSGQRQLLCLARAVLRLIGNSNNNGGGSGQLRVLLLDEATATVDSATDACLQRMLRRQFEKVTVLAIAHRLETILDFDKVLVLDQGHVAEFDSPSVLLANPSGKFRAMFDSSTSSPVTATTGH